MSDVTLKPGDRIQDNDPRRAEPRVLKIFEILPNGVYAEDVSTGRVATLLRRSIHTDGKVRKAGFRLLLDEPKTTTPNKDIA